MRPVSSTSCGNISSAVFSSAIFRAYPEVVEQAPFCSLDAITQHSRSGSVNRWAFVTAASVTKQPRIVLKLAPKFLLLFIERPVPAPSGCWSPLQFVCQPRATSAPIRLFHYSTQKNVRNMSITSGTEPQNRTQSRLPCRYRHASKIGEICRLLTPPAAISVGTQAHHGVIKNNQTKYTHSLNVVYYFIAEARHWSAVYRRKANTGIIKQCPCVKSRDASPEPPIFSYPPMGIWVQLKASLRTTISGYYVA